MNYVGYPPAPPGTILVGDTNPVGMIAWFHSPPDASWKQLNGQVIAKATYPDLWAYAQGFLTADQVANPGLYRSVDANTFAVPKLDGLFIRASGQFDANRVSGALGARQDDIFKSHIHAQHASTQLYISGSVGDAGTQNRVIGGDTQATGGAETRPTNVAFVPCVKALRTALIPGSSFPVTGQLIQSRSHVRGDNLVQAGTIPYDNTIPQITEGSEFLSVANFTPTMMGSRLRIAVHANFSISIGGTAVAGIFRTGTTDAMVMTAAAPPNADYTAVLDLEVELITASLVPITFSFRAGMNAGSGGSFRINGTSNSGALFGGTMSSWLRIDEYSA